MKLLSNALLALLAVTALGAQAAQYNGENRSHSPMLPKQVNAKWQQECSGCHLAFAPGLLPAASWRKIMSGLDHHFGADASLAAQDATEITAFLEKNQANRWTSNAAPLRVTEGKWFAAKHREIAPAVWQRASIKSANNCMACHRSADKGVFDEHRVSIPR